MRRILVVCMLVAAIGLAPNPAAADPDSTYTHFQGRAGAATLTDCPSSGPAGFTCRAVVIFAFERRANDDGRRMGGPGLDVSVFDITILGAEPFFVAEQIGFGFTEDAAVRISGSLSRGTASAQDVALCDLFDCPPGAPESISVAVAWRGFGPKQSVQEHTTRSDPFCFANSRSRGTLRSANATGMVDGVPFLEPNLPGFGATLQTDVSGTVERCRFA